MLEEGDQRLANLDNQPKEHEPSPFDVFITSLTLLYAFGLTASIKIARPAPTVSLLS